VDAARLRSGRSAAAPGRASQAGFASAAPPATGPHAAIVSGDLAYAREARADGYEHLADAYSHTWI
jgi:hypothetical protein